MSGAEVVGLISGIISIVDAISKIHGAVRDASGLPASFRDALRKMPLVKDTLLAAKQGIDRGASQSSYVELERVLESCREKTSSLEKIFRHLAVKPGSSRTRRYAVGIRTLGKGQQVEELMERILSDLQLLTANYAIRSASQEQVQELLMEMRNGGDDSVLSDHTSSVEASPGPSASLIR
ncbi:SesA protein [Hypoxylon sp. FL1284]|nr:SesA protein [Hypoxylon sp. FL1284]